TRSCRPLAWSTTTRRLASDTGRLSGRAEPRLLQVVAHDWAVRLPASSGLESGLAKLRSDSGEQIPGRGELGRIDRVGLESRRPRAARFRYGGVAQGPPDAKPPMAALGREAGDRPDRKVIHAREQRRSTQ